MMVLWMMLSQGAVAGESELSDRIAKAFSHRDGSPSCEVMARWGAPDEVADVYRALSSTVTLPPWLPIRAARCVAESAETDAKSWALVQQWMRAEQTAGLALVVVQSLDAFGSEKAVKLADLAVKRAASEPRFGRLIDRTLQLSRHPAVVKRAQSLK
jgi:hypothetical protein